jgi:competence protein ComGF
MLENKISKKSWNEIETILNIMIISNLILILNLLTHIRSHLETVLIDIFDCTDAYAAVHGTEVVAVFCIRWTRGTEENYGH